MQKGNEVKIQTSKFYTFSSTQYNEPNLAGFRQKEKRKKEKKKKEME